MGFFSVYCGLIYNDVCYVFQYLHNVCLIQCMSIMIRGWNGTQWKTRETVFGDTVAQQKTEVYHFGIDPVCFTLSILQ